MAETNDGIDFGVYRLVSVIKLQQNCTVAAIFNHSRKLWHIRGKPLICINV